MVSAVIYSLLGGLFTWLVTALGAALIFVFDDISQMTLNMLYSAAAGVMIASSCFGLIEPALEESRETLGKLCWVPVVIGLVAAYLLFDVFERYLHKSLKSNNAEEGILTLIKSINNIEKIHQNNPKSRNLSQKKSENSSKISENQENQQKNQQKNSSSSLQKSSSSSSNKIILMISAITLHNLPEGLAVGIAFGAANICHNTPEMKCTHKLFNKALTLTLAIALQNFPEGIAVAFPLRRYGMSTRDSFWYGQLSAVVEPIGALIGALLTLQMENLLPYFLSFAAGAMLYVTVSEMIPESFGGKCVKSYENYSFLGGFVVMMVLEGVLED